MTVLTSTSTRSPTLCSSPRTMDDQGSLARVSSSKLGSLAGTGMEKLRRTMSSNNSQTCLDVGVTSTSSSSGSDSSSPMKSWGSVSAAVALGFLRRQSEKTERLVDTGLPTMETGCNLLGLEGGESRVEAKVLDWRAAASRSCPHSLKRVVGCTQFTQQAERRQACFRDKARLTGLASDACRL